jgi:hypothetical protein
LNHKEAISTAVKYFWVVSNWSKRFWFGFFASLFYMFFF